jgi:hypothetical protein
MDLSLLFLRRQGLAGRPSCEGNARPAVCRAPVGARVASRALPYPALEQMEFGVVKGGVSRFRFPGSL